MSMHITHMSYFRFAAKLQNGLKTTFPYEAFCALDLTLMLRVWLTNAGRFALLIGVGATKMGT